MEIILIRHGQSEGNKTSTVQGQTDTGLSELGKDQAKDLSKHFNIGDLSAVYSSDLDRAVQTAKPTADKLNLKIKTDKDLREAHFGIWEGLTYDKVKEKYPKEYNAWHANYYVRPHWFESFESHFKRTKRAIDKILLSHSLNDRIAVFTHGGSIKTQVGYFKKLSGEELTLFTTANCSLTLIKFNPTTKHEHGKLIYYNKEVLKLAVQREL
ncbi:MAG: histidine phosphatase family protein [Candidatus Melainabacteria bacterium]|nr:histidine phosphatase family protein [Candidatus Melainabacteria bacterium]